ncbi:MAG: type I restriction enzyme HsdR N-terminal domain-containing protein [Ginsengibacter sp.]
MLKIAFDRYPFKIESRKGIQYIFDEVRKRWIILSPEEWVRQNFLQYLVSQMNYPAKLIAVEKEFFVGELAKRGDLIVYNRDALPWMIVECKHMTEVLNSKVIKQILIYHQSLPAKYLVITNGSYTAAFVKISNMFQPVEALPAFAQ